MAEPVHFETLRINRSRQKACVCKAPMYEMDTANRLVTCTVCGAVVDAFDALYCFANEYERYKKAVASLEAEIMQLSQAVSEERIKKRRLGVYNDMASAYRRDMLPVCPHCEKPFEPTQVARFTNRNFALRTAQRDNNDET